MRARSRPSHRPLVFTHLITAHGAFEADVICAHLAAEGILFERVGSAGGPYRLTVGPMAAVDIRVLVEDLDLALSVVADYEDPSIILAE